jgi:hypothetical protein
MVQPTRRRPTRERERLLYAFLELRAILRDAAGSTFPGQAAEHARLLKETEADYVSLVAASEGAMQLETLLESADREATERELDTASLLLEELLSSSRRSSIDCLDTGSMTRSPWAFAWSLSERISQNLRALQIRGHALHHLTAPRYRPSSPVSPMV